MAFAILPRLADAGEALPGAQITRYAAELDSIVPADAVVEKLAERFSWAEGPVWIRSGGYLLFTDVPGNTMYRWTPAKGAEVFLQPSGYTGEDTSAFREAGANGLFPDGADAVLVADSGNRTIARLDLATRGKTVLASRFEGRRFNSPNDVIRTRDGLVFFTDPPYGLEGLNDSPLKELPFNGVFRIDRSGAVSLLDDGLSFPNGVALSPDERTLYVSNADPDRPIWMAYRLDADGRVQDKWQFADASDLYRESGQGLPDGMAVSTEGYVFSGAPGGVLILAPDGRRLGRIETGLAIANCAFGDDGRTLYLTSHSLLARIRVSVAGVGFAPDGLR